MLEKVKFIIPCVFLILCVSCKKEIVNEDIYGYWQLENKVEFKDLAFTKLEFLSDSDIWIDPVINDSIYHYTHFLIQNDSLILTDYRMQTSIYEIGKLKDSVLVIKNFPGVIGDLRFKKYNSMPKRLIGESHYAKNLSNDSLDVIIKSDFSENFYDDGKVAHFLTLAEKEEARAILKSYLENKEYLNDDDHFNDDAFPFNQYIRQYTSYYQNNQLFVDIQLSDIWYSLDGYTSLKKEPHFVDDGGPGFAFARINLTEKKVIVFMTNGFA